MNAELERLIALQRLDASRRDAERRIADEPARQEALQARLDAARQAVADAKAALATNQEARRALDREVTVHQGRLSKYRDQLMAVKTNVEYQAMQKEIQFAQDAVKAEEEKILERMLEADDLTAVVKRAEAALAAEQKAVAAEQQAMAGEIEAAQRDLVRLAEERLAITSQLSAQVLAVFDLVSRRRNGVALAEARDGICTICHVRLRPQVFNTVLRNEQILQCDHCSRILYFVPVPPAAGAAQAAS
jgi:hypothetical protein